MCWWRRRGAGRLCWCLVPAGRGSAGSRRAISLRLERDHAGQRWLDRAEYPVSSRVRVAIRTSPCSIRPRLLSGIRAWRPGGEDAEEGELGPSANSPAGLSAHLRMTKNSSLALAFSGGAVST